MYDLQFRKAKRNLYIKLKAKVKAKWLQFNFWKNNEIQNDHFILTEKASIFINSISSRNFKSKQEPNLPNIYQLHILFLMISSSSFSLRK